MSAWPRHAFVIWHLSAWREYRTGLCTDSFIWRIRLLRLSAVLFWPSSTLPMSLALTISDSNKGPLQRRKETKANRKKPSKQKKDNIQTQERIEGQTTKQALCMCNNRWYFEIVKKNWFKKKNDKEKKGTKSQASQSSRNAISLIDKDLSPLMSKASKSFRTLPLQRVGISNSSNDKNSWSMYVPGLGKPSPTRKENEASDTKYSPNPKTESPTATKKKTIQPLYQLPTSPLKKKKKTLFSTWFLLGPFPFHRPSFASFAFAPRSRRAGSCPGTPRRRGCWKRRGRRPRRPPCRGRMGRSVGESRFGAFFWGHVCFFWRRFFWRRFFGRKVEENWKKDFWSPKTMVSYCCFHVLMRLFWRGKRIQASQFQIRSRPNLWTHKEFHWLQCRSRSRWDNHWSRCRKHARPQPRLLRRNAGAVGLLRFHQRKNGHLHLPQSPRTVSNRHL